MTRTPTPPGERGRSDAATVTMIPDVTTVAARVSGTLGEIQGEVALLTAHLGSKLTTTSHPSARPL